MNRLFILFFTCILNISMRAQQIAKADAINSLEIILSHHTLVNPADDIYDDSWDHTKVNCYKSLLPEKNYLIDIRDFCMPIKKNNIIVTSKNGYRKSFKRNHNGIDLKTYIGDTIYATFSGKIRISNYERNGYGHYIVVRHFNGLETIYGHVSRRLVKENEYVYAGQPIGLAGNTGRSTGPHLHLETRFCGISINPTKIFNFEYQDVTDDKYIFK